MSRDEKVELVVLPNLTGIRGVAAVWVFIYHFREYYFGLFPQLRKFDFILSNGHFGVDLFFCLSGFILGYVYFNELSNPSINSRAAKVKSYFLKRFARVYPLYFLTSCIAGIFYFAGVKFGHVFNNESPSNFSLISVISNFIGIQTWVGYPSLNGPAWSVSAELFAYLYFPLVVFTMSKWVPNSKIWTFLFFYSILDSMNILSGIHNYFKLQLIRFYQNFRWDCVCT
jgi:peptidoglycan/LPS O-acetylase OafA/YrhL